MQVHQVFSSLIAGFGYEKGTLRVVIKGKSGLSAYDYYNVTQEDAAFFIHNLGKALTYIKKKYECRPVTDMIYFSE